MNDTPQTPDPIRGSARGDAAVPLSVLDLATVSSGSDVATALRTTTDNARQAEALGYHRLWVAEHHSMPGIASSSPAVLLAHLAAATDTIRLGSGGVMLPNHAPLVVAEQFGTLEALHPGRIDLGLGRAPGTDQATMRALRRHNDPDPDDFDGQLDELVGFLDDAFGPRHPYAHIHAVPGPVQAKLSGTTASRPPIWLLGSSGYGARLAGQLGLPFAFAHHFAARNTLPALELYRENFMPSTVLDRPYAMVAASAVAADTEYEAARLARTMGLAMLRVRGGRPGLMPSPEEAEAYRYSDAEAEFVHSWLANVAFGEPHAVRQELDELIKATQADELMIVSNVHGHETRLRSFRLIAEAYGMA
ncbi:LLM class flavin-dependent oxidoreductase [Stackebrandtia nassauensis]|uniref:Luciferase-like monooxygenase n=1 Tax=Stackebrandtia nassauensis (strain DSM 44728 / CIP 108903 / NRRL B-16338 / NBRC 102104 / LLR-40K-21) TaxID=446470 RepID=D3PYL5_STANL|nr:LLM class flavin-dependent oxidoreductase [Stackebrandtia nassauensis]ADD43448.1 Luciferase-like monooxygenase [Stackebrandtia nassauensis DSM 44728]